MGNDGQNFLTKEGLDLNYQESVAALLEGKKATIKVRAFMMFGRYTMAVLQNVMSKKMLNIVLSRS